jgi:hypothetical protein
MNDSWVCELSGLVLGLVVFTSPTEQSVGKGQKSGVQGVHGAFGPVKRRPFGQGGYMPKGWHPPKIGAGGWLGWRQGLGRWG